MQLAGHRASDTEPAAGVYGCVYWWFGVGMGVELGQREEQHREWPTRAARHCWWPRSTHTHPKHPITNNMQAQSTSRGRPSPRGTPAAMDADVLLRVLCHRADHAASKYLKKDYKIPKKLPGSLQVGGCSGMMGQVQSRPWAPVGGLLVLPVSCRVQALPCCAVQLLRVPTHARLPPPCVHQHSMSEAAHRAGGLLRRSKT